MYHSNKEWLNLQEVHTQNLQDMLGAKAILVDTRFQLYKEQSLLSDMGMSIQQGRVQLQQHLGHNKFQLHRVSQLLPEQHKKIQLGK